MNLICIIILLSSERYVRPIEKLRNPTWLIKTSLWIQNRGGVFRGLSGILLLVIPLSVLTGFIHFKLEQLNLAYGFVFSLIILFFCLGPKSFYIQVKDFIEAFNKNNIPTAHEYAKNLVEKDILEPHEKNLPSLAVEALFIALNERILGVFFWFLLLGPAGAVLFRASITLKNAYVDENHIPFKHAAKKFAFFINWPNAHLVALSYAVVGHFVAALSQLKNPSLTCNTRWKDSNDCMLICTGIGALHFTPEEESSPTAIICSALAMVRRTIALWVGVIALLTLGGWVS